MAVNHIKVSTNRLHTDAEQIGSLIRSMEKESSDMKNSVQQMNHMWEGPSKQAFVNAFYTDMNALDTVIRSLKSIQSFEIQAKTKYETCEQQVEQLVSSIHV